MDVFWCWFSCFWISILFEVTEGGIGSYKRRNFTSHEHRLMKQLFKRYDPAVRPRYNSSHTVNVSVRFSLQQINDLDEKRQILKMSGWITAEWVDEYLQWNPDEFGGLRSLVLSPTRIWVPKLAIGNSANKLFDGEHYKRFWITVRSNGAARWQPGGVFAIACALDMNFYPFDDQKCTMEIETWVYTADKVNLTNSMDVVGIDTYIPHGEWSIIKTEVKGVNVIYRYYLDEQFLEVYCTIYIRRKHTFYFMYILLPCLMLSGVLLMIFLLPADSGEKVSLGVSILVAISVFLLLVAGNVPDTSDAIPIIAIYLTYFMMITTLAVACSVIVIMLHFKSVDIRPPQWLRVFIFGYLSRAVCIDHNRKFSSIVAKPRAPPRRETTMTWSETATEEIRSQNSHTLTPDGPDSYELFQHRIHSRSPAVEDNNIDHETQCLGSLRHHEHRSSMRSPTIESKYTHEDAPLNEDDAPEAKNEWKQMAEIMDRFFFLLFLFFLIVPTATILGIVRLFKPEL